MKMKLWIDDMRPMPEDYDIHARNVEEAVSALSTYTIEHVAFDHDLGDPCGATGYDIAMWIEREAYLGKIRPMSWSIHSSNPVGAERIKKTMINAEKYWRQNA